VTGLWLLDCGCWIVVARSQSGYGLSMAQTHNDSEVIAGMPGDVETNKVSDAVPEFAARSAVAGPAAADSDVTDFDVTHSDATAAAQLVREMNALSLTQALLDFEMANARVLDLTARLVEANARVIKLQTANDSIVATHEASLAELRGIADATNAQLLEVKATLDTATAAHAKAQAEAAHAKSELAATHATRTFRVARAVNRFIGRSR
jgi:hypothetical protein